jgi:hypothetical protein
MSKLLGAMKLKIKEIVQLQGRPFSYLDFAEFEVGGQTYKMTHGTFRNYISELKKAGTVKLVSSSKPALSTIPGKEFDKAMTHHHTGVSVINTIIPERLLKETPIYSWLKNCPTKKQALHNIRLTFKASGIWNAFSCCNAININAANKDIQLPIVTFFDYIDVIVTIHHSDTVSVAISCSFRPIAIDAMDIFRLFEALTRTEINLANTIERNVQCGGSAQIPPYRTWIVKMWHFGIDTRTTYGKKEFEVTIEEGMADLYRIYTKRMEHDKNIVRVERQENPNQAVADALIRKLFPDGQLVIPGEGSDNAKY